MKIIARSWLPCIIFLFSIGVQDGRAQALSLSMAYSPLTVFVGQPSVLQIAFSSSSPSYVQTYADFVFSNPNLSVVSVAPTNCGPFASNSSEVLVLVSVGPNASCTMSVTVRATATGSYTETVPGLQLSYPDSDTGCAGSRFSADYCRTRRRGERWQRNGHSHGRLRLFGARLQRGDSGDIE